MIWQFLPALAFLVGYAIGNRQQRRQTLTAYWRGWRKHRSIDKRAARQLKRMTVPRKAV